MATYGIMRIEKRARPAVYGLQIEANRKETDQYKRDFFDSDIDWTKTKNNIFIKRTENWNREIARQIKEAGVKERKDSIVLLDGLYTCSPDWIETHSNQEILQYFRGCLDFHVKEYCNGDKSRIINAVLHLDEKTIHLHIASTCIYQDETGMHLSAKTIMGGRDDYRLRQDRFFNEVSSHHGMERGEQREPSETKIHTTKREWQIATQESKINNLQMQKELLEFDVSELTFTRRYENGKTEQAKQQRKEIENEINTLLEKQIQLQEHLDHNIDIVKNWKDEVQNKIKSINEAVSEFQSFTDDLEKQYIKEMMDYVCRTLDDVPANGPEFDFNTPATAFNSYDEEEYEL